MESEDERVKDQIIISLLKHADWENRMLMTFLVITFVLAILLEINV